MPIGLSTFTADNIVAILDGKRDRNAGKDTAYRVFADQWERVYPGAPPRGEAERMVEMQKALEKLGVGQSQNGQRTAGSLPERTRAPRGSRRVCECGNQKDPAAVSCTECMALDSRK